MIIFDFEKIRSNPIKFFIPEMCFEQKLKDCDSELKKFIQIRDLAEIF